MPSTNTSSIKVLVVGAGRGRLALFALDAIREAGRKGEVHVIDASPRAIDFLRSRFKEEIRHGDMAVHDAWIVSPAPENPLPCTLEGLENAFNIIVSEVFGSFGDNEFLPEIVSTAGKRWGARGHAMIPQSWTTYVAPIQSSSIAARHLKQIPHVMGVPDDCVFLSVPQIAYTSVTSTDQRLFEADLCFECSRESQWRPSTSETKRQKKVDNESLVVVNGFIGFFSAELWKGISIDTRMGYDFERNTFHWEAFFFPVLSTPLQVTGPLHFSLRRRPVVACKDASGKGAERLGLCYEWSCHTNMLNGNSDKSLNHLSACSDNPDAILWLSSDIDIDTTSTSSKLTIDIDIHRIDDSAASESAPVPTGSGLTASPPV